MDEVYVQLAAIISTVIFVGVALFQVLLALGFPLGRFAWGGFYKVLPKELRIASLVSANVLILIGLIFLQQANVVNWGFTFIPTTILVWVFTGFLALNTVGNLLSRSKKEKMVMAPLSTVAFLLCLFVSIASL